MTSPADGLRIVLVLHHWAGGAYGAESVTRELARAWRADGHDVSVVSFSDLPTVLQRPRVAQTVFPWFVAVRLARSRADLVDATTGDTWLLSLVWRARRSRPFLAVRSHGLEHLAEDAHAARAARDGIRPGRLRQAYFARWRLWEVGRSARSADVFRVLSERERSAAVLRVGVAPDRVVVGPNGVPDALVAAGPLPVPDGPFCVASTGSWQDAKGADVVPAVFGRLRKACPDARLLLLGTGVPADRVLARFAAPDQAGVDVVESFDPESLRGLLGPPHVYLSASWSEGFSLALVEAMACGLVPVVTDVGAARDTVADAGIVCGVGDVGALAGALSGLAARADDLGRARAASAARVAALGWETVARETVASYAARGLGGPIRRS